MYLPTGSVSIVGSIKIVADMDHRNLESSAKDASCTRKRGRPRRFTLEQILDAALEVGLHGLTMTAVARRLGVVKPVLYNYVDSRNELIKLAAMRSEQRQRYPVDRGQSWTRYTLEFAKAQFEQLTADDQLLESWLFGGHESAVEIDITEDWLRMMTARGFSSAEALHLRRAVSYLVVGAAAHFKYARSRKIEGGTRGEHVRKLIELRPVDEIPLVRDVIDIFSCEPTVDDWEYALVLLLQGVLATRQEGQDLRDDLELKDMPLQP